MQQIYAAATGVLVWLGNYGDHRRCFDIIQEFFDTKDWNFDRAHAMRKSGAYQEVLAELQSLLRKSYWSRMWIVQEIMLPKNALLMHGSANVSWARLSHFLNKMLGDRAFVELFPKLFTELVATPGYKIIMARQTSAREKLYKAVFRWRDQECKDPRDHVFFLLGITEQAFDEHGTPLQADYSRTAEALYLDVISRAADDIQTKRDLHWLCRMVAGALQVCEDDVGVRDTIEARIAHWKPLMFWEVLPD